MSTIHRIFCAIMTISLLVVVLPFNVLAIEESGVVTGSINSITGNQDSAEKAFQTSTMATEMYANKKLLKYEEYCDSSYSLKDGLTVIYGNNIDMSVMDSKLDADINNSESVFFNTTNNEENTVQNQITFLIMCLKNGERVDRQAISVSYANDVNQENIDLFVDSQLTSDSIDRYICEYLNNQTVNITSALNAECNNTRATNSTRIVFSVLDSNYYVANYETDTGGVYPVVVYQKNITYDATIIASELANEDRYVITAYVNVTPGNELSSSNYDGVYNSTYSNVMVIKGVRTYFQNTFPEDDRYIAIFPQVNLTDVNDSTISGSAGFPPSISLSTPINFFTEAKVNLTSELNSYGTSTVTFEAHKRLFSMIKPCLSTKQFNYVAAGYLSSGGNALNTVAGTDILYYFQNQNYDNAVWAGSGRTMFYVNDSSN